MIELKQTVTPSNFKCSKYFIINTTYNKLRGVWTWYVNNVLSYIVRRHEINCICMIITVQFRSLIPNVIYQNFVSCFNERLLKNTLQWANFNTSTQWKVKTSTVKITNILKVREYSTNFWCESKLLENSFGLCQCWSML